MADEEITKKDAPEETGTVHTDDETLGEVLKKVEVNGAELKEAVDEHKETGVPMTTILEKKKGLLDKIMGVLSMDITSGATSTKESATVTDIGERETLADALLKAGWITEDQLAEARLTARQSGAGLGKVLIEQGFASVEDIQAALAYRRRSGKALTRSLIDVRLGKTVSPSPKKKYNASAIKKKRSDELAKRLVELELLTAEQVQDIVEKARKSQVPLDEYLVEHDVLSDSQLALVLSDYFGVPIVDLEKTELPPGVLDSFPRALMVEHACLPFKIEKESLHVVFINPRDMLRLQKVGLLLTYNIVPYVATKSSVMKVISEIAASVNAAGPGGETISSKIEEAGDAMLAKLGSVSMTELVSSILEGATDVRSTDIHLDPQENFLRVRYRIDGVLHDVMNLPLDLAAPVISRLKVMANMDIIERMHAQDGHINLEISGRIQDLRLASAPTNLGEKVTIRIMDPKNVLTGLHMLGLEDKQLDQINQLIYKPYGMILATGPVGSGKTTTLYSCLNKINVPEKNVMTVEDPVEYRLRGMNQMQVDHKRSYEFADGLKAMLRQDPNVIMVGEVRDAETARIAVRASLTGVLVFSTMHANDGPGTISTLYNHGIPGFLVSSSLIGVIAQRLVRKLCQKCKEAYAPDKELLRQMKVDPDQKVTFYRPVGCADCFNTGYYGRTGVYEIMLVEDELRDLIFRETTKEVIRQVAIDMGMQTMKVSCFNKAIQGVTSAEEYFRVVFI